MKSWTKQAGANSYRFRTGTALDRKLGNDMHSTIANVVWDEDQSIETGLRFAASLDVRVGDRVMVVAQTSGLQQKPGKWILTTTARSKTYIHETNVIPLPRFTFAAIQDEVIATLIWCALIGTAAAAVWQYIHPLLSAPVVLAGLLWFGIKTRDRIRQRRWWKGAIADEQQFLAQAGPMLDAWAADIRREDDAAPGAGGDGERHEERSDRGRAVQDEPWWVTLGVAQDATLDQITSAKRKLMNVYHPDKWMTLPPKLKAESERQALLINAAFEQAMRVRNSA